MNGKTVLITGATSGIGLATAETLAGLGATVVLHGRNQQKLVQAMSDIRTRHPSARLETLTADLSSLSEVRRLARELIGSHDKLDVLINNAGVAPKTRELSRDGFELQFAVNYLAPFLLTHALLEPLQKAAPARIINVGSSAQGLGKLDFQNLQAERHYDLLGTYARNKLALTMMTVEWAARLAPETVTVNVLEPGWTQTSMSDGMETATGFLGFINRTARLLPFLRAAPGRGAATSVYLASSPAITGITGQYFTNKQKIGKLNPQAQDPALRAKLWRITEELTGLAPSSRPVLSAGVGGSL